MEEETKLPKPQTDLPLPEKKLPSHSGLASQGETLQGYSSFFRNKIFIAFVIVSFLAAFLIGGFVLGKNDASNNSQESIVSQSPTPIPTKEGVVCAQDVRQCSDGSYVGRTGPKCEFACPE